MCSQLHGAVLGDVMFGVSAIGEYIVETLLQLFILRVTSIFVCPVGRGEDFEHGIRKSIYDC